MNDPASGRRDLTSNSSQLEQSHVQEIIDRIEAERVKMAREIHDEAGQLLIAAEFRLDYALSLLPSGMVARDLIEQARKTLDECRDELHRIAFDLRPRILDDFGLIPALRSYLKQSLKQGNIELQTELAEPPVKLAPALELGLFRILQEAMVNVQKHAQATGVRVQLTFGNEHAQLEIADNGIGFEAEGVERKGSPRPKLGLLGLRERAVALGGEMEIVSHPGEGTTIRATLPIGSRHEFNWEQEL